MKSQINIAELLEDCPKGMELDCVMFENVTFEGIKHDEYPIIVKIKEPPMALSLTKYGGWNLYNSAKCVIFPKGKTNWEGFQRPFMDGDVVSTTNGRWIGITTGGEKGTFIPTYCVIQCDDKFEAYLDRKGEWAFNRLATEEEKQKLFGAIKDNGYKWNEETKTLEKLVKPWTIQDANDGDVLAFNDETIVIFKDLYNKTSFHSYCHIEDGIFTISKEDTPDWWEGKGFYLATKEQCNLLFQKIKEAGYIWNEETKTLDKLVVKSKFKVGDCVVHHKYGKGDITQILWLADEIVYEIYFCDTHFERFTIYCKAYELCNYELVQVEPKFKAGDKIVKKGGIRVPILITGVGDTYYWSKKENSTEVLSIAEQDDWELVPNKFDISALVPFDSRVLVRDNNLQKWSPAMWGYYDFDSQDYPYKLVGCAARYCIPYEKNEHLLGTTNDCDNFFKTW